MHIVSRTSPENAGFQVSICCFLALNDFSLTFHYSKMDNEHLLQILDRNWGAGWNLLSLLLATKSSSQRIR